MKPYIIRTNRPEDVGELKNLWHVVFGDTKQYIDGFFETYLRAGTAVVLQTQGQIVSAIYKVPMAGVHYPDGHIESASITYALATLPRFRRNGYGLLVMKEAIRQDLADGCACSVLCPAEDSLFPVYTERIGYQDCFYLREAVLRSEFLSQSDLHIATTDPKEYNYIRNRFLDDRLYIRFDNTGVAYQKELCMDAGGDMFLLRGADVLGCACCEYTENGTLLIKELLCPECMIPDAVSACVREMPAQMIRVRTPVDLGLCLNGSPRRYGQMLRRDGSLDCQGFPNAYYGFGFD